MARAHVPEFGAWDNGLMYTAMFDEARAAKGGRMMNPNDPAENPDLAALYGEPAGAPRPRGSGDEPRGGSMANVKDHEQDEAGGALHATRPRHARRFSWENLKVRRSSSDPQVQARPGVGGHTPERSPLHPRAWKVGGRDDSHQAGGMDSNANPSTPPPPRNAQSRTPGIAKVEDSAASRGFGKPNTDPTAVEENTETFTQHNNKKKTGEAVRNRSRQVSPARNDNKSHKSGTSFQKDKRSHCTIM